MAELEMPKYKCHKVVQALKIAAIEFGADGAAKFAPAIAAYGTQYTGNGFRSRWKGDEKDLGYFVVYEDGYESWAPTKAFEEGYTRI